MLIHSLFILQKSGACLYSRNFTNKFKNIEANLITPFFSAIFSFSENVIMQQTPEILEMGGFRFVFMVERDYIFVILSDSSASLLFIKSRLIGIIQVFEDFKKSNDFEDYEEITNRFFDLQIHAIIAGSEEIIESQPFYSKVIDMMKNLIFENEILGAAVFSINGNVIYTSLPQDILLSSLKEFEIRHTVATEYRTTFYSLENDQKIFSRVINIPWKLDPLYVVVFFDSTVSLGMAELNLEKISKTIQNII
ncbi:MAG: hypothetical protein ACTSV5_14875 [Promethearchaeota archaeon]